MDSIIKEMWEEVPMKVRYSGVFLCGALLMGLGWLTSCSYLAKYAQDNILEEVVEYGIKQQTGLDLDLTPFSPETVTKPPRFFNKTF